MIDYFKERELVGESGLTSSYFLVDCVQATCFEGIADDHFMFWQRIHPLKITSPERSV